jgi:predicted component of type VI protein secretion system
VYVSAPSLLLVHVAGPQRGARLEVGRCGALVGRAACCELRLPSDLSVSPLHARLSCHEGRWHVADCGSRTGTAVLVPDLGMHLDTGDAVRIGETELRLWTQPSIGDAAAAAPPPQVRKLKGKKKRRE